MPKRSSKAKNHRDLNQIAAAIVGAAVGESLPAEDSPPLDPVKAAAAWISVSKRLGHQSA